MNVTYITVPVFMALIVGFATQLEAVAEDSSNKALAFSDDMNKAMDCATRGIPISICSPNLTKQDFTPEQEEFQAIIAEMQTELENVTVVDEDNQTVIIIS